MKLRIGIGSDSVEADGDPEFLAWASAAFLEVRQRYYAAAMHHWAAQTKARESARIEVFTRKLQQLAPYRLARQWRD